MSSLMTTETFLIDKETVSLCLPHSDNKACFSSIVEMFDVILVVDGEHGQPSYH